MKWPGNEVLRGAEVTGSIAAIVVAIAALTVTCATTQRQNDIAAQQATVASEQLAFLREQETSGRELAQRSAAFTEAPRFTISISIREAVSVADEQFLVVTIRVANDGERPSDLTRLALRRRPIDPAFLLGRRDANGWAGATDLWSEPRTSDQVLLIVGRDGLTKGSWSADPFTFAAGDVLEQDVLVGPRIAELEFLVAELDIAAIPQDATGETKPYGIVSVRLVSSEEWAAGR